MSGGAVCVGLGDVQPGPRVRPEAVNFAAKQRGGGMASIMTRINQRPQSRFTYKMVKLLF